MTHYKVLGIERHSAKRKDVIVLREPGAQPLFEELKVFHAGHANGVMEAMKWERWSGTYRCSCGERIPIPKTYRFYLLQAWANPNANFRAAFANCSTVYVADLVDQLPEADDLDTHKIVAVKVD